MVRVLGKKKPGLGFAYANAFLGHVVSGKADGMRIYKTHVVGKPIEPERATGGESQCHYS